MFSDSLISSSPPHAECVRWGERVKPERRRSCNRQLRLLSFHLHPPSPEASTREPGFRASMTSNRICVGRLCDFSPLEWIPPHPPESPPFDLLWNTESLQLSGCLSEWNLPVGCFFLPVLAPTSPSWTPIIGAQGTTMCLFQLFPSFMSSLKNRKYLFPKRINRRCTDKRETTSRRLCFMC